MNKALYWTHHAWVQSLGHQDDAPSDPSLDDPLLQDIPQGVAALMDPSVAVVVVEEVHQKVPLEEPQVLVQ